MAKTIETLLEDLKGVLEYESGIMPRSDEDVIAAAIDLLRERSKNALVMKRNSELLAIQEISGMCKVDFEYVNNTRIALLRLSFALKQRKNSELEFAQKMAELYEENRSDVAEMCRAFVDEGVMPDGDAVEARFVMGKIPGTPIEVEYDTLTTLMSYRYRVNDETPFEEVDEIQYDKGSF